MTKPILTKKQLLEQRRREMQMSSASMKHRAAAVTVGTAFGGTVELTLRNSGGNYQYAVLQPVEAIEVIHQIAAAVGCHIALKPRNDFSSWREWRESPEDQTLYFSNHPPFANIPHNQVPIGRNTPASTGLIKEQENEQTLADKKLVKRRSTKRAATVA
jgi:hypothetical protein